MTKTSVPEVPEFAQAIVFEEPVSVVATQSGPQVGKRTGLGKLSMANSGAIERGNQRNAVLASFFAWTFDAYDFFVLTFVITDVARSFGRSRPDIALTITLSLAMRPVGALIFGVMADRVGRRLPMILNVLLFAVLSVASGLAPTYRAFLLFRLLFGIALGAQWGVGASLALESVSPRWRGLLSGLLQGGYTLGNLIAAIAFRLVYPAFGWRALFFLGGAPVLLSLFIMTSVKESPVWSEHRSDWGSYRRQAVASWRLLAYFVAFVAMAAMMAHGTQDMYPTFLRQGRQFSAERTAVITMISMIGACAGGLLVGWFSDRVGRRRAMVIATVCGLGIVPIWVAAPSLPLIIGGAFVMQFCVQGAVGIMPAHLNELTPGSMRGFFPGFAYQVGVMCASSITYVESLLGEHFSYAAAMGILVSVVLVCAAVVFAVGPEKKGVLFGTGGPSGEERPKDAGPAAEPEMEEKLGSTRVVYERLEMSAVRVVATV
jgi:SHS family lactate transporter-like MFS transporter